jgi:hypothetical protein
VDFLGRFVTIKAHHHPMPRWCIAAMLKKGREALLLTLLKLHTNKGAMLTCWQLSYGEERIAALASKSLRLR